jgi:hypothetical protein
MMMMIKETRPWEERESLEIDPSVRERYPSIPAKVKEDEEQQQGDMIRGSKKKRTAIRLCEIIQTQTLPSSPIVRIRLPSGCRENERAMKKLIKVGRNKGESNLLRE